MRLLTALTLVLSVTGSSITHAQDEDLSRYYPLDLGDTWTYTNYHLDCFEQDCDVRTNVFVRRTVVGEVVIDDETYAAVEVDVLGPDAGNTLCTSTYGARVDVFESERETEAFVNIIDIDPPCDDAFLDGASDGYLEELRSLANGTLSMQPWQIGGVEYDLMIRGDSFSPDLRDVSIALAQDVGLLDVLWFRDIGPGFSEQGSFTLRYAEVGGMVYGQAPVANEGEAAPAAFALGAAYPNPFRATTMLVLSLPTPEAVTLAVFDVLGRRVLSRDLGVQPAGESRHTLDGAEFPAGVYFVRATTASGVQATRRVVRVE